MPIQFNKLNILVVEDCRPMATLLSEILYELGVGKVNVTNNAKSGYEIYSLHRPDIVITDWKLEEGSGLDLIDRIRNAPKSPEPMTPVIMITGFAAKERVDKARDTGVTEYLIKPFTAGDLAKRISYVINKPRDFIKSDDFFGPDRRRRIIPGYNGPLRRDEDTTSSGNRAKAGAAR